MNRFFLAALILVLPSVSVFAEKLLPVEAFANKPDVTQVLLAPNGRYVAALVEFEKETSQGVAIQVYDLSTQKSSIVGFAQAGTFVINWIRWATADILLVSARFPTNYYGTPITETRLLSIHVHTLETKSVLSPSFLRRLQNVPQFQDHIIDLLPGDDENILMAGNFKKSDSLGAIKVNLKTGRTKNVLRGKDHVSNWITDRQHRIRVGLWRDETKYRVMHQEPGKKNWNILWEFEAFSEDQVWPMSFDKDPDILYVRAYHEGRLAVFKVRLSDPDLVQELVFSDPDYDAEGSLIYSKMLGRVIGIRYSTGGGYTFWDKEYQDLQETVDASLPDTSNTIYSLSDDERRYVALATSDTDPGVYYVGDRDERRLSRFATRYPDLPVERMADVESVSYQARDGLAIEGFLTLPKNQRDTPYPAIIFPHGGPISYDGGGFNYWTQYFTSRGYAVLQMNFRGSAGYGYEFMKSGLQAWGLEMQNDVEDGTRWLIDEGIADPERICVVGASYGGYAALMEAAHNSDLYQCAVSFAGVTDVADLVSSYRNFTNYEIVKEQVGSDFGELRKRSPLHIAEEINIPILLAHGTKDRSVKVRHSRKMNRELKKRGGDVTYLELEDGDHYLSTQEHRVRFFTTMDEFLRSHLH